MTLETPANGNLLSADSQAVLQDPEFQNQTWQRRAEKAERDLSRYRAQLDVIFGPEVVDDWATEGLALPPARIDTPGAIDWEAQVSGVHIKRSKTQGPLIVVTMSASLPGAPVRELAGLTDGAACLIHMAPMVEQLAFSAMEAERMARQIPRDDDQPLEELPDFDEPEQTPEPPKALVDNR